MKALSLVVFFLLSIFFFGIAMAKTISVTADSCHSVRQGIYSRCAGHSNSRFCSAQNSRNYAKCQRLLKQAGNVRRARESAARKAYYRNKRKISQEKAIAAAKRKAATMKKHDVQQRELRKARQASYKKAVAAEKKRIAAKGRRGPSAQQKRAQRHQAASCRRSLYASCIRAYQYQKNDWGKSVCRKKAQREC